MGTNLRPATKKIEREKHSLKVNNLLFLAQLLIRQIIRYLCADIIGDSPTLQSFSNIDNESPWWKYLNRAQDVSISWALSHNSHSCLGISSKNLVSNPGSNQINCFKRPIQKIWEMIKQISNNPKTQRNTKSFNIRKNGPSDGTMSMMIRQNMHIMRFAKLRDCCIPFAETQVGMLLGVLLMSSFNTG